jgi:hypothetical protein
MLDQPADDILRPDAGYIAHDGGHVDHRIALEQPQFEIVKKQYFQFPLPD